MIWFLPLYGCVCIQRRLAEMAVEMIQTLIPCPIGQVVSARQQKAEKELLAKYLLYWTSMTLHPVCDEPSSAFLFY